MSNKLQFAGLDLSLLKNATTVESKKAQVKRPEPLYDDWHPMRYLVATKSTSVSPFMLIKVEGWLNEYFLAETETIYAPTRTFLKK